MPIDRTVPFVNAIPRRRFLGAAAAAVATSAIASPGMADAKPHAARIPLGLDGYSLRSMRWKASELIDFAGEQKLDAVLLNGLNYFESLEKPHLKKLRDSADTQGLKLYCGAGAIAKNGKQFRDTWGTAEEMLALAIETAKTLGSPVVNVRIGSIDDRFSPGGIQPKIDEAIRVLKASSSRAADAGLKFGFENHAADLRSEEVVTLVEEVGTDVCGVMLDPGNGLWAMEDPMEHLDRLAPYTVCNSVRDYTVWPTSEGALFQWTAVGEGMMDVPRYTQTLAEANPGMPIFVETISNSPRPISYLSRQHWEAYPDLKASEVRGFLSLVRTGKPATVDTPNDGQDHRAFDQEHQRQEFLRSITYLRQHGYVGLKLSS